jgi:peptidoglycan hydrolase-like protein with peptidoglycan-binding domain
MHMDFSSFLDLLRNNRQDLTELFSRVGGLAGVFDMAPAIFRIINTLSKHQNPTAAAEHAERVLYYSQATKDRVAAFQKAHGLAVDGIVGDQTWNKVEELIGEAGPGA